MTNNSHAPSLLRPARPDPALPGVRGLDQGRLRQARAGRDRLGTWGQADPARAGPRRALEAGRIEYKDLLKLIVCTEEFDARLLEQPTLDLPKGRGRTRGT